MTSEQFAYWLQGFSELNSSPPSAEQWQAIRDHLQTVFVKVTPQIGFPNITQGLPSVMLPNQWLTSTSPNMTKTMC